MNKIYMDTGLSHILTRRMIPYWLQQNWRVTDNPSEAKVQLSFVRFSNITPLPKILRLDSVYYNTDIDYKSMNYDISQSHAIADGIVYQSDFSEYMVPSYLTERKPTSKTKVIYNGIERGWAGDHIEDKKFHIVVSAIWRRHKRLKEIIQIFLEFVKSHNTMLHILGSLEREDNVYQHPQICYYKHVDYNKMASIFQKAHVSLHLSKRDSCPNTVIEAIGAGIPVITTNSCGGATDMAGMTNGCIICNGDDNYYDIGPAPHYRDEYNVLQKNIKVNILNALEEVYKDRRRVVLPEKLTIENVSNQYIKFMKEVIGEK
jgi:glycosyltransferase involved in cell wall biosynthesis